MSQKTDIAWTGATWNPVRGCSRVSPECTNCYAERIAARFSGPGLPYEGLAKMTPSGPRWTGKLRLVEEKLEEPLHWRKPSRVFVNSMSDLFHENKAFPAQLANLPRQFWGPSMLACAELLLVLRSRNFLVQVFTATAPALVRLTVCRTAVSGNRWLGGITWDDLQRLKAESGYSAHHAVEVYPADVDLVDVENMRHLWVLAEPPAFVWRAGQV